MAITFPCMLHGCVSQSHRSNRIASLESHRIARIASHRSNRSQGIARWNRSLAGCLTLLDRSLLARPVALAPTPADVLSGSAVVLVGSQVCCAVRLRSPILRRSRSRAPPARVAAWLPSGELVCAAPCGTRRCVSSTNRWPKHIKSSARGTHISTRCRASSLRSPRNYSPPLTIWAKNDARPPSLWQGLRLPLRESHCEERIRLESLHEIALENAKAQAAAARAQDRLELERLLALTKRLRSERDQARADALRYCEERNTLRKTVAELRLRQSEAAVRDAARVRLSFPDAE